MKPLLWTLGIIFSAGMVLDAQVNAFTDTAEYLRLAYASFLTAWQAGAMMVPNQANKNYMESWAELKIKE